MSKGKIVFVVGHSHWGKSKTLCALTNNSFRTRRTTIAGVEFFIRRMSNDDQPADYVEFMKSLSPDTRTFVIAALCPNFHDEAASTNSVLTALKNNGYQLFFWVIEHQYGTSETVSAKEIERLRKFGDVEVFSQTAEAEIRAKKFKQFVANAVGT